jgi:predicted nuclease of predicted toxin-antitoxin system
MKILLDTCIWRGVRPALEARGHDVVWVGEWQQDPGDEQILAWAFSQNRVVVTLDKDFGELAIVFGRQHSGIVRLVGMRAREQAAHCLLALDRYMEELTYGAIVTVEPGRVRIRSART